MLRIVRLQLVLEPGLSGRLLRLHLGDLLPQPRQLLGRLVGGRLWLRLGLRATASQPWLHNGARRVSGLAAGLGDGRDGVGGKVGVRVLAQTKGVRDLLRHLAECGLAESALELELSTSPVPAPKFVRLARRRRRSLWRTLAAQWRG